MFKKYYRLNLLNTTSHNSPVALAAHVRGNLAQLPPQTKETVDARS
jgi:hypothetical protein